MRRRLFKLGNSIVVSLPRAFLRLLNLKEGSDVSIRLDRGQGLIVAPGASASFPGVDVEFGRQVAEFIEEYRPALEALASGRSDDS